MKGKLCNLRLIAPAFSNHEIEQLKDNKEYINYFKRSNLYMIVQRKEIIFTDFRKGKEDGCICFSMSLKNSNTKTSGYINIDEFFENRLKYPIEIAAGEKGITLTDVNGDTFQILTEYIWYFKSRDKKGIYGFDNYLNFTKFNLHYIGISKSRNSFTRLVEEPHDKRLRILLKEEPYESSSKIKDELYLLFFEIRDMDFKIIENVEELKDLDSIVKKTEDMKKIADAEKAFVNFLKCNYNEELYEKYPISVDGLYLENIDTYTYQIQEDITLISKSNSFVGRYGILNANYADFIGVRGKEVFVYKANVDN